MRLAELTWRQLEQVPRSSVVVVPVAGFEQHSLHLPFGTDAFILNALTERIDARIGDRTLFLPTVWLSHSGQHLPYAGTLSLPPETVCGVLAAIADQLADAGFGRTLFLNGQYGNDAVLELALRTIRAKRSGVSAVAVSYWSALEPSEPESSASHAGALETSLLLHLRPELVVKERLARDGIVSPSPYASRVIQYRRMDQRSHHGGFGDPESASADDGERLLNVLVDALIRLIRDFHDGLLTA